MTVLGVGLKLLVISDLKGLLVAGNQQTEKGI